LSEKVVTVSSTAVMAASLQRAVEVVG